MTVMAPKDENELRHMLRTAVQEIHGPVAIRYPRGAGVGAATTEPLHALPLGRGETLRSGADVAIFAVGAMVLPTERAGDILAGEGIAATIVNARFVKPIDERLILELAGRCGALVTVEENVRAGGFGSAVLEVLDRHDVSAPTHVMAVPDRVFEQASQGRLRELAGLTPSHIAAAARELVRGRKALEARVAFASGKPVG
jgi:1-deoxy-D-xylulose-5-phosphate synthase